jgi:tetratricopeptide (TPR) repeat protein
LERGDAKDAAWHALYALDLDPKNGLGWSAIARILSEVSNEVLGTLAARHALELGVPEEARAGVEKHHRIDLWARGLMMHAERRAILPSFEFDDPKRFESTSRLNSWFEAQIEDWDNLAGAADAARRMVGALSDAYDVPESESDNPLRAEEGWTEKSTYRSWKAEIAARGLSALKKSEPHPEAPMVISDYWMEQEVVQLAAGGLFDEAVDQAKNWTMLRPNQVKPKAALLRVLHAAGKEKERDITARQLLSVDTNDLNDLEEARIAFGELKLWREQLEILDRMDQLAPDHPVILTNRGVARIELGERDRGAIDLERALELDSDNGAALANLGLERMRQDNYVAARTLLERAVSVAPDQVMAHVYLAACKNNQGDRSGAIASLEEALKLEPSHDQAQQMLEEIKSYVARSRPS